MFMNKQFHERRKGLQPQYSQIFVAFVFFRIFNPKGKHISRITTPVQKLLKPLTCIETSDFPPAK